MHRTFPARRVPLLVTALAVLGAVLTTMPAATAATHVVSPSAAASAPAASKVRSDDVYIRDVAGDNSSEPDTLTPVWESPDIWVCNTPAPCPPGVNPIAGATNWVNVTLNNTGPSSVSGDIYLYYTAMGGAAVWPTDWNPIGVSFGVVVPAAGTTVTLPWPSVPGPGHFCLLARWVSAADPMTFAEGPNTLVNTANDNNIAWHNVNTVRLNWQQPTPVTRPFTLGNATASAVRSMMRITATSPFIGPGQMTVDLGPTLGKQWLAEGSPGVGVQPAGGTLVRITDPKEALIEGLTIQPKQRIQTTLTFLAKEPVDSTVLVDQMDANGNDMGGVGFAVTTDQQQG